MQGHRCEIINNITMKVLNKYGYSGHVTENVYKEKKKSLADIRFGFIWIERNKYVYYAYKDAKV